MGTTLTGTTPQDTYDALIKVTDNGPISGTLKALSDGLGNDTTLSLSTTAASIAGTLAVTGNATFDTSTLVVDATNNRVGIGTASPTAGYSLSVLGAFGAAVGGAYVEVGEFDRSLMVLNHTNASVSANLLQVQKSGTGVFTINPAGIVQIASGIQFPATQVASADANTLDDYEEGTFTPTIVGTSTAGTATYVERIGTYTKIGNVVNFSVTMNYNSGTGTGNLRIGGLPFTSSSQFHSMSIGAISSISLTALHIATAFMPKSVQYISFEQYPTGGGGSIDVPFDAQGVILVSGSYTV